TGEEHGHYDWSIKPPGSDGKAAWLIAQSDRAPRSNAAAAPASAAANRPAQAASFAAFAPRVNVRWDERSLFVESNGLPAHNMMVGISAWQQQVPLPQNYTGNNAWQFPLSPIPAKVPQT